MNQAADDEEGPPRFFCLLLPYFCRHVTCGYMWHFIHKIPDNGPPRSRRRDMKLNSVKQPFTPKSCRKLFQENQHQQPLLQAGIQENLERTLSRCKRDRRVSGYQLWGESFFRTIARLEFHHLSSTRCSPLWLFLVDCTVHAQAILAHTATRTSCRMRLAPDHTSLQPRRKSRLCYDFH